MKIIYILFALVLFACSENAAETKTSEEPKPSATKPEDSIPEKETDQISQIYSNARFKDVTVEKIGDDTFLIKGKGQIFEANFNWVVEDGHDELKKGFEMTDAGASEWGNFSFTLNVAKKRPNSTLHLILFESSAKVGSRQHELPILLN